MIAPCPPADELVGFALGALSEAAAAAVELHIDACAECRAALSSFARGDTPTLYGRYRVDTVLGAGGMGIVYRAWDPELARAVAIKVLRAAGADELGRARLVREAQSLARLSHPNVCHVYDVGRDGDEVWIAMEMIDGVTLRDYAAPRAAMIGLLLAVAEGLAAAHAAGLVHRDVKPENVLVTRDGRAIVTDFGLARGTAAADAVTRAGGGEPVVDARLTATGVIGGTPAYLAPEQLTGGAVDARADQFAWAVMAWELLTGVRPFAADLHVRLAAVRAGVEVPAGVPAAIGAALVRALSAAPADRFASMRDVIDAMRAPVVPAARRRGWPLVVAAAAVIVAVGGGAAAAWRAYDEATADAARKAQPQPQREPALQPQLEPTPQLEPKPQPQPKPELQPQPEPQPKPRPRLPSADASAAHDTADPPASRAAALGELVQECVLPFDPDHPDPALVGLIADWGKVTRVERVEARLGDAPAPLTLIEVAGHRATYRFKDVTTAGRLATRVGGWVVLCVRQDDAIYTVPPAWQGLQTVIAAAIGGPPRITELAAYAPLEVAGSVLLGAGANHRDPFVPGRRYVVQAKVGAQTGARFAMGSWWLDVPDGVHGIATGGEPWIVVEDPVWEPAPDGGKPRLVLRAVAALATMFP